jgi:hypothetical protein
MTKGFIYFIVIIYFEVKKMGVVTDSYTMNIQIIQHGLAKIVAGSVVYPAAPVEINTPFTISYQVRNDGAIDTLYGHLLVGITELANSAWTQANVPAGTVISKTYNHPGITASTTIILEVGHN